MGLEIPSRSLGIAHLALFALLLATAVLRAGTVGRRVLPALAVILTIALPVLWTGPLLEARW